MEPINLTAILARTSTDKIKSKQLSNEVCELVLEVYITPTQFAQIMEKYFDKEFKITIS